jgi:hypothetical protein
MSWRLAAATLLAPGLARACPSCARDGGPFTALFIAAMIAAPYAIGWLAVRAIRDGERSSTGEAEP